MDDIVTPDFSWFMLIVVALLWANVIHQTVKRRW